MIGEKQRASSTVIVVFGVEKRVGVGVGGGGGGFSPTDTNYLAPSILV